MYGRISFPVKQELKNAAQQETSHAVRHSENIGYFRATPNHVYSSLNPAGFDPGSIPAAACGSPAAAAVLQLTVGLDAIRALGIS